MNQKVENFRNSVIKQFAIYLIVGAGATIVEWICFYLISHSMSIHYAIATTIAFTISTYANWILGKVLLFTEKSKSLIKELTSVYATSIIGLSLNLLIMWIEIDRLGRNEMMSKVIATGIVFFWNFLIRKLVIYKI